MPELAVMVSQQRNLHGLGELGGNESHSSQEALEDMIISNLDITLPSAILRKIVKILGHRLYYSVLMFSKSPSSY